MFVIRRLGQESSNDALVGVLEGEVVVGTALASLDSSIGLGGLLDLGMRLLDEGKPSGQVRQSILADKANGDLVGPQSLPDLGLELSESVALEVRPQRQVLVQVPQEGLNGAEVAGQLAGDGFELLVLHFAWLIMTQMAMKTEEARQAPLVTRTMIFGRFGGGVEWRGFALSTTRGQSCHIFRYR